MKPSQSASRRSAGTLREGTESPRTLTGRFADLPRRMWVAMRDVAGRPEVTSDLLLIVKAVVAATVAWWLAVDVLESPVPFLAPWVALLTVYPTVYQSVTRGVQSTIASWAGVGLSFLIGTYLGVGMWTFALALAVGLVLARVRWIRDEGVAIATTGIFVLGSGFAEQQPVLDDRLIEVAVGAGVGIAVNLLLIPPLRDREAARYVDSINHRMGEVLTSMAEEFSSSWDTDSAEAWVAETESMSADLDSAWQSVHSARESRWANPRHMLPSPRPRQAAKNGGEVSYEEILERVDESISHLRNLARTLREASYAEGGWDTRFRAEWADIVRDAGHAIAHPDAQVEPTRHRLERLAEEMALGEGLPRTTWPLYGSLISSMLHIIAIVDDVASAREAREANAGNPEG